MIVQRLPLSASVKVNSTARATIIFSDFAIMIEQYFICRI